MRYLFTAAIIATAPAYANETQIQTVIDRQIEAFQIDDFEAAFTFASPNIQRLFGSSERFGAMVRAGYPMVWRATRVEYLGLEQVDGLLVQEVLITDQNGNLHVLEYQMIEGSNGWRINGVQLRKAPEIGA